MYDDEGRVDYRLVRATKRMANGLKADWTACYVETARTARLSKKHRDRIMRTLRLAERLGADTTILTGEKTAEEVVNYARRRNVTKIVIGKPERARWKEILFGSTVDDLIRKSGNIDVYVITGDDRLLCLTRKEGKIRWVHSLPQWEDEKNQENPITWTGPLLVSDKLIMTSSDGYMEAMSPYDGRLVGRVEIPSATTIAPVVANGVLYLYTNDAELVALR